MSELKSVTAYQFAKIFNSILADAGIKEVPPQFIYNYKRKNKFNCDDDGRIILDSVATSFVRNYIQKKQNASVDNTAELAAELKSQL